MSHVLSVIKAIQLNNAEQKISYDKYLDDLVGTVKNKKIQYFYKSEFKTLFFKKLKQNIKKPEKLKISSNPNLLKQKQVFSFLATAINHNIIRIEVLESLENYKQDIIKQIDSFKDLIESLFQKNKI